MNASELAELVRRHAGLIRKIAYGYCRNATDREDVEQEIAAQLWRCRGRYDPRFKESTWVYRIALNTAISFHRRESRHHVRREPVDVHEAAIADPSAVAPSDEVRLLLDCIEDLGALDKALVLLYLDGNDHGSIAEVLGISVSNAGTKLHRIKERLRVAMESRGRTDRTETPHESR